MEILLGYDLRMDPVASASALWPEERRARFLIRGDIAAPLSVDRSAWPSLFRYPRPAWVNPKHEQPQATIDIEPKDFAHLAIELWQDIDAMRRATPDPPPPCLAVAITVHVGDAAHHWLDFVNPSRGLPTRGQCVGFDVADSAMTSGLCNCGFLDAAERQRTADEWSGLLGDNGLFRTSADAARFVRHADRRVREHAPFFVFAIYFITP